MTKRLEMFGRLTMVAALALLLTGCLKLDMNLEIQADDTVNGSVVFAVSKDVLELTGGSAEDLLGSDTPFPSDVEGVTTEEYDDGKFAGQKFNFDGLPISEFSDPADPESLQITRDGDTFKVTGVLDLSQGLSGATGATGGTGAQFLESAEIRVAITFPGEIIDSNGQIDGNTVVWEPKFGERLDIQATGSAIESGGSSSTLLYVLIGVGAVVVIAIIAALVMGRKKKGPAVPPVEETLAPTAPMDVTAPMDMAAVPPAPETAPAAPPEVTAPTAPAAPPEVTSPSTPEPGPGGDADDMPPPPPSQA